MRPSFEDLIGRARPRERVVVFERLPPAELVAAKDILRVDQLGRTLVACPRGTVPAAWLQLTDAERAALVDPPPPMPDGTLIPGPGGFTPHNVAVGFVING